MKSLLKMTVLALCFCLFLGACSNPDEELNIMLNRAKGYAQSNEFAAATECARNALELNQSDSRIYMLLALIERMQVNDPKELDAAISHAKAAVTLAPDAYEPNHILAMMMLEKNPYDSKAIAFLEKAAKADPKRLDNLIMLAEACLACRQPRRAYEVYKRISIFPEYRNNFELYNQLGFVLTRMNQFSEAERAFLKSISLSSGHPTPQLNLARLYDYKIKNAGKAITAYDQYCVYAGGQVELIDNIKAVQSRILEVRKNATPVRNRRGN